MARIHPRSENSVIFSRGYNLKLPLWKRAIFVDWHGVLSKDVFWFSVLNKPKHPLYSRLRKATDDLFQQEPLIIQAWMKGEMSSSDVVEYLCGALENQCGSKSLLQRLSRDCKRMEVNQALLSELRALRNDHFIILATDNMDCLVDQVARRPEITATVDAVLCSSVLGVLKSENIERFFSPWLYAHQIDFNDGLLIDDSESNCRSFIANGGTAIQHENVGKTIAELKRWTHARRAGGTD